MTRPPAVTKSKRPPRLVPCPACEGKYDYVRVLVKNLRGPDSWGLTLTHIPCPTCGSTGKVKRAMTGCPCCNGPKDARCENCANAGRGGSEVHVCLIPTEDEIAYETELLL